MATTSFGKLTLDPARNPAVLATATWQPEALAGAVMALAAPVWDRVRRDVASGRSPADAGPFAFGVPGRAGEGGPVWTVARLADGQQGILAFHRQASPEGLPDALLRRDLSGSWGLSVFAADMDTVAALVGHLVPAGGPRALGPIARLGIGTRMSTAVWPGVWAAMGQRSFDASAIQNSVRELNLLDDLVAGAAPRVNYLFGFGRLEEGHTGSTFEGLWLAGVLSALAAGGVRRFGADADHIMVKRTPDGLERAMAVVDAARHYTFFTLDVSDVLDYAAGRTTQAADTHWRFEATVPEGTQRRELLAWHSEGRGGLPPLSAGDVGRGVAKFWRALGVLEAMAARIRRRRGDRPFDLELSIDEVPSGIAVADVLTTPEEVVFLLGEIQRRGLPVTHLAPNLGVEKGTDYRLPDGLAGLGQRTASLHRLLGEAGLMLDCHSGDDLGAATRRAIGRATGGLVHFKISPSLQLLFAEVLQAEAPEVFRFWWNDTLAYARREAQAGSELASRLLADAAGVAPSPRAMAFHLFSFATVGRRSAAGAFLNRERFYALPTAFDAAYTERVKGFLLEVAADLYGEA